MQNDFISGALGFDKAKKIIPEIVNLIKNFEKNGDDVVFTADTHEKDYLDTIEGKKLPIAHCIKGTDGWEICDELKPFSKNHLIIEKPTFGSEKLGDFIAKNTFGSITLVGLVTDICVVSNAIVAKASAPNTPIRVVRDATQSANDEMREKTFEILTNLHIEVI